MDIKSELKSIARADQRVSGMVRLGSLPPIWRTVFAVLAHSGDSQFWWPVLVLVWVFGSIFWKQWVVTAVIGIALAGAVQWVVKRIVRRDRPIGL